MESYNDDPYVSDEEFSKALSKKETMRMLKKQITQKYQEQEVVYDEILSGLFTKVPPGEGDEFAAVKPWLGSIKEPKNHPKVNPDAPKEKYSIDWVYGYRNEDTRMNLHFNCNGQAVYPAAAIGIIYDYKQHTQQYFGGGITEFKGRKQKDTTKDIHTDDITALAVSPSRHLVVSGQNG